MHRIAAFAFAFALAISRCQWRHRCVVTLDQFLVVLYSKPLWRKENWKQRPKGDVWRCKTFLRAMLKNREGHHSDDAVKKGDMDSVVKKLALCIAALCVAALWCTKAGNDSPNLSASSGLHRHRSIECFSKKPWTILISSHCYLNHFNGILACNGMTRSERIILRQLNLQ